MFNKYYVFAPQALDTSFMSDITQAQEVERQRLVAEAQTQFATQPQAEEVYFTLQKCA